METFNLHKQIEAACRHLLSEQNRDPYTPTYGCFDRRFWGWKLVDFPEATFQRNVYPLAKWMQQPDRSEQEIQVLTTAVRAGLEYAFNIQHKDGSFDQAFPNEHSYGATAFLLHPLLEAYQAIHDRCTADQKQAFENGLRKAADFLCRYSEEHGHIANHLAGSVLSLLVSAYYFSESHYEEKASELLSSILANQSGEGWFLEYEGADPGYQTLCLYYLAQVYTLRPVPELHAALEKSINFLAWFVHPDGTFGGEYGSRRTSVFYPGGLALLSNEFPLASSITSAMLEAVSEARTVTLNDIDIGNFAPLLSSYILLLDQERISHQLAPDLPCKNGDVSQDFPEAGLYIRGNKNYYAILGVNNGGVFKVFNPQDRTETWDDGGYVGRLANGDYITTQITWYGRKVNLSGDEIQLISPFYKMLRSSPTPLQFIMLRILNLSIMSNIWVGNLVKKFLVDLLISGKKTFPLELTRSIRFKSDRIVLTDVVKATGKIRLQWLMFGRPFVGIHMASARYFQKFDDASSRLQKVDVDAINSGSEVCIQLEI
jgi:hypothetical protein